jgi:hypothetical protein
MVCGPRIESLLFTLPIFQESSFLSPGFFPENKVVFQATLRITPGDNANNSTRVDSECYSLFPKGRLLRLDSI